MDSLAQLPLNIGLDSQATFTNFLVGDNRLLLDYLQRFSQNNIDWFTYLWGAPGSGRTHLLHATYYLAEQRQQHAAYIPLREIHQVSPKLLENLEDFALVILDDVQLIVGNRAWEEAVFHLYNRIQSAKHKLIMSADQPPQQLNIQLPDLQSRITAGVIFKLHALSEAQKVSALQLRATQLGLNLPIEVAQFMLHHCPRDLPSLFITLEKLDRASLAAKRKLTLPFLKQVLNLN